MRRQVELIGAAWGLGGADPGCAEAPEVLAPQLAVSQLCRELAAAVAGARRAGRLPCVLGGDHSCAGGTWTGVARTLDGPLGLIWIDAHMDSHTPATTHTGRLHGMPLAWLLGEDDNPLDGLGCGVLEPSHVCLVGVRSYEREEDERLRRLGVRVIFMDELRRRGLGAVLAEAIGVAGAATAGFGLSIDLDVVTPEEAPHVGTPVAGGVGGAQLARALEVFGGRPDLAALELVEYSPLLDRDGRSARIALDLAAAALCGPGEEAKVVAEPLQR